MKGDEKMPKTSSSKKAYNKRYYREHPKMKKELLENQNQKQRANPRKYAKIQRDRYHSNKEYRDYKIEYAKDYYKKHKKRLGNRA